MGDLLPWNLLTTTLSPELREDTPRPPPNKERLKDKEDTLGLIQPRNCPAEFFDDRSSDPPSAGPRGWAP